MREEEVSIVEKFDKNNLFVDVETKDQNFGKKQDLNQYSRKTGVKSMNYIYPKNGLYGLL